MKAVQINHESLMEVARDVARTTFNVQFDIWADFSTGEVFAFDGPRGEEHLVHGNHCERLCCKDGCWSKAIVESDFRDSGDKDWNAFKAWWIDDAADTTAEDIWRLYNSRAKYLETAIDAASLNDVAQEIASADPEVGFEIWADYETNEVYLPEGKKKARNNSCKAIDWMHGSCGVGDPWDRTVAILEEIEHFFYYERKKKEA